MNGSAHDSDRPIVSTTAGQRTSSPPIAMLPGLGYPEMLHPLMRELSAWTTAMMLNVPGWQRQRATASAPTIAGIAEATADWLRHVGGPPLILLGHSTGAQAALHTAILAPGRVAALVLVGPTVDPAARSWPCLIARYCQPLWREPPTELVAVRRSIMAGGISPVAGLIASALADRPEQLMAQLSMPTMILAGKHDRVASPTWCRQLADLGQTRLQLLPGGHNSCFPYAAMADHAIREAVNDWWA